MESLAPQNLALGQIVAFETEVTVSGLTTPENGEITLSPNWSTDTTNGDNFGYDPSFGLYCAFVDTADSAGSDADAKVSAYSWTAGGGQIDADVTLTGLDDGETIVVEMWVVLDKTIPVGTNGNVPSGMTSAVTGAGDPINVGAQTVPLNKVQAFFTAKADLSVSKSDSPDPVIGGNQLTYTITVTNNSTDTVANDVKVEDDLDTNTTYVSSSGATCSAAAGKVTCDVGAMAPGAVVTITIVVTVSTAAPNNDTTAAAEAGGQGTACPGGGDLCNLVSVSALTDDASTANNHYFQPTNVIPANAEIHVVKSSTTTTIDHAGQVVPYRFEVSNPGNVTLTTISVTDPKCDAAPAYVSGDSNADGKLQTTETWVYTCSHTVTAGEFGAKADLSNTVTADSAESAPDTDTLDIPVARIHVVKTSTTSYVTAVGQTVDYTFTVTNTGSMPLTVVTVSDPLCDAGTLSGPTGDTGTVGVLGLTETWVYTCDHTVTAGEFGAKADLSNTVTADSAESRQDTDTLDIPVARIHVEKTSTTASITAAGQSVPYRFAVTNTGSTTLSGITVTDPAPECDAAPAYVSGDGNADSKLQTSETWVYSCTHTVTQGEVDAGGNLSNTVTADSAESAPDSDTLDIPVAGNPHLSLTKVGVLDKTVVAPADRADVGDQIDYTLTATNDGNQTLTGVTISDPKLGALVCTPTQPATLVPAATLVCTGSYTLTQVDIDAGTVHNKATADSDQTAPVDAVANIALPAAPALTIDKTVTPATYAKVGDVLGYSYVVTNTGNVTLTSPITVTDDKTATTCPALPGGALAPGESITCSAGYTVTQVDIDAGSVINSAFATSGPTQSNTDIETALALQSPALSTTKSVRESTYYHAGELLHYTYVVTNTGNVTLAGPVTVTDDKTAVSCPPGGLAPGAAMTCTATYTVTQADVDRGSVTNTAFATSGVTRSPSVSATVGVTRLGHVTVVKDVSGDVAGAESIFTFRVSCPAYSTDLTIDVAGGTQAASTPNVVPVGTACTVTETGTYEHWTLTSVTPHSGSDVTVGTATTQQSDGTANTVTFVNARATDVVTVEKTRVGDVAGASTDFAFTLVCPAYVGVNGPLFPWAEQTLTVDTSGSATATATSDPIPTDVECTVAEVPTSGWQQTEPAGGAGATLTVPGGAAFTNTRNAGDLALAKAVHTLAGPNNNTGSYVAGDPHNTLVYTLTMSASPPADLDHTGVVVTDRLPGYRPGDDGAITTTYVDGSATCSTGCTVTYDDTKHLLTWDVGSYAHDAEPVVLTFQVTIDQPTPNANGGIPVGTINNVGFVGSQQQDPAASNEVSTPVVAVQGEKHRRPAPEPAPLPFTGSQLPIPLAEVVGLTLLGVGMVLTVTARRRRRI